MLRSSQSTISPWSRYIIGSSLLVFTLIFLMFLVPIVPVSSYAAPAGPISVESTIDLATTVKPAISIAVESQVNLDVRLFDSLVTSTSKVLVATNSHEGYSLFLETAGDTNDLLPVYNKTNKGAIKALEGNTTENNFPSNHWGYTITGPGTTNMGYRPVPITATDAIAGTKTEGQNDSYDLTFAVKVDTSLMTDTYKGSVLVSAVANPTTARNLTELYYMQDMTSSICANTMDYVSNDDYTTKQLIDTRDGKSYQVAKLADGNCWMTQNLELVFKNFDGEILPATADNAAGDSLTPANTDIASEWAPSAATKTSGSGAPSKQAVSWYINTNNASIGYQSYYSWDMATAATGTSLTANGAVAPSSICPKGWKLPLSGTSNNDVNGSFYNLLNAYGLTTKLSSVAGDYEVYQPDGSTKTYTVSTGEYSITGTPLEFVKSGWVSTVGNIEYIGTKGNAWSSVSYSSANAYRFNFDTSNNSITLNNNSRTGGYPVRCLSR